MKIVLMGNPNVGKSAIFSRLTGVNVIASNYPGSTIEYKKGFLKIRNEKVEIIDTPGIYSLTPNCKAEEIAVSLLEKADVVINVIDSTNLERNLYLTMDILEKRKPTIIVLNMWDDARHKGIQINKKKLEEFLQVPIIPTIGVTGEGIKDLVESITYPKVVNIKKHTYEEKWVDIGHIIKNVQNLKHRHHTFLERLQDFSVKPLTGIPLAIILFILIFFIIRFIGEGIIGFICEPLFEKLYSPLLFQLSNILGENNFFHKILIGKLVKGEINFVESFGLLTTGLFVPFGMILPYIISFYFILGILEDFGYLPRLAVLMDTLMHKIGLHGYTIIPIFLGLGCNVPGILATRILESKKLKFITATLISICIPCTALQAMIIGYVGKYGIFYVILIYMILFIILLILSILLNKITKGFSPELFIEIPPYRLPRISILMKKLWMRVKEFLLEAVTIVLGGILLINILFNLNIFDYIANFTSPVISKLFGLPKETIIALLMGFLRKDIAVGMLSTYNLSVEQLVVSCVVLSTFFPCIATFIILLKELGIKDMIKSICIMLIVSISTGTLLNHIFKIIYFFKIHFIN